MITHRLLACATLLPFTAVVAGAVLELRPTADSIAVHRAGAATPLVVQMAKPDFRPYLHPIHGPDGKGVLTEFSPGHHKHQTGLYIGVTRINGRDHFHHPGDGYFTRKALTPGKTGEGSAAWTVVYDLNGANGKPVLAETQTWTLTDAGAHYLLDLEWTMAATVAVTVGRYDYGGLFMRMPWTQATGGTAVNSLGDRNGACEGKPARWVDVGMPIAGRDTPAHIAVIDHPGNPGHPVLWRVDGQLGVGPCRARSGDWSIPAGQAVTQRYRLVVYAGALDTTLVDAAAKALGDAAGKK